MKGGDDVVSDPPRTRPLLHPTPAAAFLGAAGEEDGATGAQDDDGVQGGPS